VIVSDDAALTWLGHSSILLELDGMRLITDPLLRRRVLHLKRRVPLLEERLDPDATLISHVHWDHLDFPSLRSLGRDLRLVVPRGAGKLVRRRRFTNVVEVGIGEEVAVGPVSVRATYAEHDIGRGRGSSPALGFLIAGSRVVYFAGDTDVFAGMADLGAEIDVAVLPIGGWGPTVPEGHMDPERAVRAIELLRARVVVPVHYGTYRAWGVAKADADPAEELRRLLPEGTAALQILEVGERLAL
jgi:L-ascorbate metabolism protein UlaG (beta-lactamase superfamily)